MKLYRTCIILLFGFLACGDNPSSQDDTGTLKVSLTDAPAAFEAVNVTFAEISANIDDEWITVRGETITVNLLEWNNGKVLELGTAEVPAGQYKQIRLMIESASVTVDGQTHSVFVPSGAQTGLKLIAEFTVNPGSTFELILDFDANRSVVTTGPPQNPTGYILKPTVRVEPKAITGSISGMVANAEHLPVAYAIAGSDTVTSTAVDTSGSFMLAFLPENSYTVSAQDTLGLTFRQSGVTVVAGSDNSLGEITLE